MVTLPSYAEDIQGRNSPSISMLSEVAAARKITVVSDHRSSNRLRSPEINLERTTTTEEHHTHDACAPLGMPGLTRETRS
jgi:hypothetical protein